MLVLGLDSALQSCSAAILRDGEGVADKFALLARGHAEFLAPMVAEVLNQAGLAVADLDRIGVVVGPGTFAGVRVGVAFARGLVLGTNVEIVGITSLEALAAGANSGPGLRAAVIDARRGQVYGALYNEGGETVVDPFVLDPEGAQKRLADGVKGASVLVLGSGAGLLPNPPKNWRISAARPHIDAKTVARLAMAKAPRQAPPTPLYLRPPDAAPSGPSLFEGLSPV